MPAPVSAYASACHRAAGRGRRPMVRATQLLLVRAFAREVARPLLGALTPELVQVLPGVKAGVVAVIENQFYRVLPHRLDGSDADVLLAEDQHLLAGPVPFDFGGGRVHAQVFEGQLEMAAVREGHLEHARGTAQSNLGRDELGHRLPTSIGPALDGRIAA